MSLFSELKRRNVFRVAALYFVTSWLLLQVADVLLPNLGAPDWAFGLVLGLLILGFPIVLIFSWVFEVTPEGVRRESPSGSTEPEPDSGRKLNLLIVVMLALAIAAVGLDRLFPERAPPAVDASSANLEDGPGAIGSTDDASIAVLPFADLSAAQDQAYLSDGLAEELLNLLSRVPELRVASRTSAFSYKGKDVRVADIADELHVAHVLEGSVRKSGDLVRITAQLIDARQDTQLWSGSWDRTLEDVFAIQDDIAAAVVAALRVTLLGETPTAATTSAEAYTLYLQAGHLERQGATAAMQEAVALYRESIALDERYAPAWIGLGQAYSNLAGSRLMAPDVAHAEAKIAAEKALELAPDDPNVHTMLGWSAHHYEGDYEAAARHYRRALALDPNGAKALNAVALFYRSLGRLDDAILIQRRLTYIDPVNAGGFFNLGMTLVMADDLPAARAAFMKSLDLAPNMVLARVWMANVDYYEGEYESSLARFEALSEETGNDLFRQIGRAQALPGLGQEEAGAAALTALEEGWGRVFAYVIATLYAQNGDRDAAFEWLDRTLEFDGPGGLTEVRSERALLTLHDDPRWPVVLEAAGLSDAQIEAISLPTVAGR